MSAIALRQTLSFAGEKSFFKIDDPGNGKAIPANQYGTVELVSAGAETRTLAVPAGIGLRLVLVMKTDGGDIVVTVASAYDQAGSTTLTFNDAGDFVVLESVQVGTAYAWRLVAANGVSVAAATVVGLTIGVGGSITTDKGTASATAGAATLSKMAGVITSEAITTAAGADYTLTLTNTLIAATSIVLASVFSGTNTTVGLCVHEVTPGSGSAVIKIRNDHASAALDGTIKIAFLVLN